MRLTAVAAAADTDHLDVRYILHLFIENERHECIPLKVLCLDGPDNPGRRNAAVTPEAHWPCIFLHITDY